ncbi:hypothetical protein ACH5RR_037096 [Cinchona calisaya]|uniref:Uncharacterized protein n=1 Tax=Cinchona calisaya TaxID=153742 RepID=A0ABD2Y540_9GENT
MATAAVVKYQKNEALDPELEHQTYQASGHEKLGTQGSDVQQNEDPAQATQKDIAQAVEGQEAKDIDHGDDDD